MKKNYKAPGIELARLLTEYYFCASINTRNVGTGSNGLEGFTEDSEVGEWES